jgi:predicted AlkP superfamily pyrophosphatase or phosphodiesterase
MRKHFAACLLWALLTGTVHPAIHNERMVIVISLDGFPAYALDDPRLPIPTLRQLARLGAIASSMRPVNPTVTWPNHTAMVTGVDASRHGVVFNGLLTRNSGEGSIAVEPWRDKDLLVRVPTVYDSAFQAGLTTAEVDWVAIYKAKTITWRFPEVPDPKGLIEGELIANGVVTADQLANFDDGGPAWQDQIRTDAAVDILERHKPNLTLVHLTALDDINHEYGPMGDASLETMAFLDDRVRQIMDALHRSGLSDRATILIVSDHGFRKTEHTISPNVVLRQNNFTREVHGKTIWDAWVVPNGGVAMVYADDPAPPELVARLHALFAEVEGVDHVYDSAELAGLGLPLPQQSDQAPQLLLAAKPGYVFGKSIQGDVVGSAHGGTHGYLNSDPQMQAIFFAWGNGIRPGVKLNHIENLDVGPTIAALLGVDLRNVTGHPLNDILADIPAPHETRK